MKRTITTIWTIVISAITILASEPIDSLFANWTEEEYKAYEDSIKALIFKPVHICSLSSMNDDEQNSSDEEFSPSIGVTPIPDPDVPTSISINKNYGTGKIEIKSGKSQTGARTYEVPIEVIPGYAGFQPNLALNYNSQSGNSSYGYGWALSGVSMISRTPQSIFYNYQSQGIKMSVADALSLDGMRLIKLNESDGYFNFESSQGHIRVKGYYNDNDDYTHFEVFYPDGNKGIFGYSDSSDEILSFPLIKLTDIHGNEIIYDYTCIDNKYELNSITYNNGCKVEFEYDYRTDARISYSGGVRVCASQLLKAILIKTPFKLVRTYSFEYINTNNFSLMKKINCTGSEGGMVNPVIFYYNNDMTMISYSTSTTQLTEWYVAEDPNSIKVLKGKMDYVSKADGLVVLPALTPYWADSYKKNVFENLYTGDEKIFLYAGLKNTFSDPMPNLKTENGFIDILFADLTGSQEEYLIKINNTVVNSKDEIRFSVYRANPLAGIAKIYERKFSFNTVYKDSKGNLSVHPKYYYTGDFNGDGKMEILAISVYQPFGDTSKSSKFYLFDLESNKLLHEGYFMPYKVNFLGSNQSDPQDSVNKTDKLFAFDYDGDGSTDLCLINDDGINIYSLGFHASSGFSSFSPEKIYTDKSLTKSGLYNRDILLCDYNGDGLVDIVVSPSNLTTETTWYAYSSRGNGSFEKTSFPGPKNSSSGNESFFVQDVNGDGQVDFIHCTENKFNTYLGTNRSFANNGISMNFTNSKSTLVPADINTRNCFTQLMALKDGVVTKYSFTHDVSKEIIITGMADSHGVIEHTSYATIDEAGEESGFYTWGHDAVFPYVNICEPIWAVSETKTYHNGTLIDSKTYKYDNAVMHRQGLGFCGFEHVYEYDRNQRQSTFTYLPYQFGLPSVEETPFYKRSYSYNNDVATKGFLHLRVSEYTEDDLARKMSKTITFDYDEYDNPISEITTFSDKITITKNKEYLNSTNIDIEYYIGFPTEVETITQRDNSTHTETYSVADFMEMQPLSTYNYINGFLKESISYSYNKGLCESEENLLYDSTNGHSTTYEYDEYGRLTSRTSPMDEIENFNYDDYWNLKTSANNNGVSQYTYDEFNRLIKTQFPDGTIETINYIWSNNGALIEAEKECIGKPFESTGYDAFGRETLNIKGLFGGKIQKKLTEYDSDGNVTRVSAPFTTSPSKWSEYEYDSFNRISHYTDFTGKEISYHYNGDKIAYTIGTIGNGPEVWKRYDSQGLIRSSEENADPIRFYRNADGQPWGITTPEDIEIFFEYDDYGRRTKISDPATGETTYSYDEAGNVSAITNSNGDTMNYTYDMYNRLIRTCTGSMDVDYTYDNAGRLSSVSTSSGLSDEYAYDAYGRITEVTSHTERGDVSKKLEYADGNVSKITYKLISGIEVTENHKYSDGYLHSIIVNNDTIFKLNGMTDFGYADDVSTGPLNRLYVTDENGYIKNRKVYLRNLLLKNMYYDYDVQTQNLISRQKGTSGTKEIFKYDEMDRLIQFGNETVEYHNMGTPMSFSDVGTLHCSDTYSYRITGVTPYENTIPIHEQHVDYFPFSRVKRITGNGYTADFEYNGNFERVKMYVRQGRNDVLTRYYALNCYNYEIKPSSTYEILYLGGDYYHAPAALLKQDDRTELVYIVRDHQGSITSIHTSKGITFSEQSYDAWGRLRNPATNEVYGPDDTPNLLLGRGYTGHEHLPWFGLINMNARLYDPVIGQFLSADPYIQNLESSQSHNRYAYALNNPLRYVDENGEFIFTFLSAITDLWLNIFKHGFHTSRYDWRRTVNAWRIDTGMFKGNLGQIINKWTWGYTSSLVGRGTAHILNFFGKVDEVTDMDGVLAVSGVTRKGAFTIGHYSMGPDNYRATWKDHLFVHEYGHYIQSQRLGPAFLGFIGIPSMLSSWGLSKVFGTEHSKRWFETNASKLGAKHFDKKYGSGAPGYEKGSLDYFDKNSFSTEEASKYRNPRTGKYNGDAHPIEKPKILFWDFLPFL